MAKISDKQENNSRSFKQRFVEAKVLGLPLPLYLLVALLVIICMYTGCLPKGLVGALIFLMVLGEGLNAVGGSVPFVRTYFGGSVVCILGSAVIQAVHLIPADTYANIDQFINVNGFLVFYISALITGSLFNIDRDLLLRATVKLLPVALLSLFVGIIMSGILGIFLGYGFRDGILFIGIPMSSGGMTAGTVPLSGIYASTLNADASYILARMAPATVLGNCVAIVYGGILNNLGAKKPAFTGNGQLVNDGKPVPKRPELKPTLASLCTGLVISLAFYQMGALSNRFITFIPTYAWMIIAVIVVKSLKVLPERLEDAAKEWGQFVIHSWTSAALVGIGISLIDLNTIMSTLTLGYLVSVILIVTSICATAFFTGRLVGFYPLESAIAAGLCTTNMGGSGNVAVLSSADRMELLPFAQIVTRSCGALMLTLGGILVQVLR